MQKRDGGGKDKASQMSVFTPHPKETARCRDRRDRQGQEMIPPVSNPKKEDPTPQLSQEATQKCAS